MTLDEFNDSRKYLLALANDIQNVKRPAYIVGSTDVLKNFKSVAGRTNTSAGVACITYLEKHYDSIRSWFLNPDIPQAEDMAGSFADMINYTILLYACYREKKMEGYDPQTNKPKE